MAFMACNSFRIVLVPPRAKSEDVKGQVPQFDASFEDRLKELKQQGSQKLTVSLLCATPGVDNALHAHRKVLPCRTAMVTACQCLICDAGGEEGGQCYRE